jgi:GNAT superfamily N-acetyltransferase
MLVEIVKENKKEYMDLLLLADEQEDMIDKYLEEGDMFALYDDDLKTVAVVKKIDDEAIEIKNIATYEKYQGKGYGRKMIKYIEDYYKNRFKEIYVGTGDSPLTIPFYENCGFEKSHVIKNFFIDNYNHEIIENGIKLVDMIYLKKNLR